MDQKEGGTHGNVVWVFSNSEMNTNVTNECYKQVECKTQIKKHNHLFISHVSSVNHGP